MYICIYINMYIYICIDIGSGNTKIPRGRKYQKSIRVKLYYKAKSSKLRFVVYNKLIM